MSTIHPTTYIDARAFERDFSLSVRTFFLWIKEGKLTVYTPSRRKTLVKREDVERLLDQFRAGCDVDRIVSETVADVLNK
jgi:predicted site-specific integrase-resolvase